MNHTPGPWIAYDEQLLTSEGGFIARFSSANYPHQNNANARLAAAAPNLLEELEHAMKDTETRLYMLPVRGRGVSEQKDILSAQIGRYRGAIRKAKGED